MVKQKEHSQTDLLIKEVTDFVIKNTLRFRLIEPLIIKFSKETIMHKAGVWVFHTTEQIDIRRITEFNYGNAE